MTQFTLFALVSLADKINCMLSRPIRAANALRYISHERFPNLGERVQISNETGWLAPISFMAASYPSISRLGIMNKHQLAAVLMQPSSQLGQSVLSNTGRVAVGLAEPLAFN